MVAGLSEHIFIYGPPVSGKSTIGKLLAQNYRMPFIDLDRRIEENSGKTIPDIFSINGEDTFRTYEKTEIQQIISGESSVVALGGGALLDPECRKMVEAQGWVICLRGSFKELVCRLDSMGVNQRPLLTGNQEARLQELLISRANHYGSFNEQLDTDGKSPERVAWEVQILLGKFYVQTQNDPNHCWIQVQTGGLDRIGNLAASVLVSNKSIVLVTDHHVGPIYAERVLSSLAVAGYNVNLVQLQAGEEKKSLETVAFLWDRFLKFKLERRGAVIALGGGVVSDVTGFASATYLRGVPWAIIPTTLLSMADASLGGKTGIDLPQGKNLAGVFHTPGFVLADPDVLQSLPKVEMRNGLAEVIKHGIVADPDLFDSCASGSLFEKVNWPRFIARAMAVKVKIVQNDPLEKGERAVLNFGHTIGHGLEMLTNYRLRHGEAVAIGMAVEAGLAEQINIAQKGTKEVIIKALSNNHLPYEIPSSIDRNSLLDAIQVDKKRSGGIVRFSLPRTIGQMETDVKISDLRGLLQEK